MQKIAAKIIPIHNFKDLKIKFNSCLFNIYFSNFFTSHYKKFSILSDKTHRINKSDQQRSSDITAK